MLVFTAWPPTKIMEGSNGGLYTKGREQETGTVSIIWSVTWKSNRPYLRCTIFLAGFSGFIDVEGAFDNIGFDPKRDILTRKL
jgi:hypothetical protein